MLHAQNIALTAMILAVPLNGIHPVLNIGELSQDGFFYTSLIYLLLSTRVFLFGGSIGRSAKAILASQSTYLLLIALSFVVNATHITENRYGLRTGIERYAVSVLTYTYYLVLTVALFLHATRIGVGRFTEIVFVSFIGLGVLLSVIGAIEIASWYVEPLREAFGALRGILTTDSTPSLFRLSGISLEPSFSAFATLSCVPWALYGADRFRQGRYIALALILIGLCLISGTRTAYVGLGAMALSYLAIKGALLRLLTSRVAGSSLVLGAFVLGILVPVMAFNGLGLESSVSDVSRGYLMFGAIDAGLDRLQGQGYGQVAFHVVQTLSPTIYYSWELVEFFRGVRFGELPPLFSWYARSLGEFGPIGYALLGLSFLHYTVRLFRTVRVAADREVSALMLVSVLLIGQFLAIGFSIESTRIPQYWLAWLFSALSIHWATQKINGFQAEGPGGGRG